MEAGDIKTACERFEESQRMDPAPGTLLNLADCEERAGRMVLAAEHYKVAASGFGKSDPRRAFALEKSTATAARVAKVTFKIDSALPADAVVHVGDTVLRKFGEELAFDPGPLNLTVEAKGHEPKTTRLELEPGKKMDVTVEVGPEVKTTVENGKVVVVRVESKGASKAGSPQRTIGLVGMIAGGVALAAGSALGLYALDRGAVYGSHCNRTTNACDADGVDAASSVSWLAPVSTILMIGGGAIGATGIVLFLTAPKDKDTSSNTASVSLTPWASPAGTGLRLSGTF